MAWFLVALAVYALHQSAPQSLNGCDKSHPYIEKAIRYFNFELVLGVLALSFAVFSTFGRMIDGAINESSCTYRVMQEVY